MWKSTFAQPIAKLVCLGWLLNISRDMRHFSEVTSIFDLSSRESADRLRLATRKRNIGNVKVDVQLKFKNK